MRADRSTLANALRVAALQYLIDATTSENSPGGRILGEHFRLQAKEVNKLADDIEQANSITLHD